MVKRFGILCVAFALVGCKPTITEITVEPSGATAVVSAKVFAQGSSNMSVPAAAFRSATSTGAFTGEQTMSTSGEGIYTATLTGLSAGLYQARVGVTYGSASDQIKADTAQFLNGEYFGFDSAQGDAGWTFIGIYDDNSPAQVAQCNAAGLDTFPSRVTYPDFPLEWPIPANSSYRGALFVLTHPGCFPNTEALAMGPLWKYALKSPSLESKAGWQGITGFSCRFQSNRPGITVQALVRVRKTDGTETFIREMAGSAPVFHEITPVDTWQEIVFTIPSEATDIATVLNVQINVFGDAVMTGTYPEGANYLDAVYPIH